MSSKQNCSVTTEEKESPKDRVSDKGHTKVLTASNVHEKRQKLNRADLKGRFALFLY